MTRKEAAEKIIITLEKKFQPINIKYENGYFVFDLGDDGVVHFYNRGLHGWKFVMWIETNPEKFKGEDVFGNGEVKLLL